MVYAYICWGLLCPTYFFSLCFLGSKLVPVVRVFILENVLLFEYASATVEQWNSGTVEQWNSGTVHQCSSAPVLQCSSPPATDNLLGTLYWSTSTGSRSLDLLVYACMDFGHVQSYCACGMSHTQTRCICHIYRKQCTHALSDE
jgi:hypothetical protein